jgi:hypothetical protein
VRRGYGHESSVTAGGTVHPAFGMDFAGNTNGVGGSALEAYHPSFKKRSNAQRGRDVLLLERGRSSRCGATRTSAWSSGDPERLVPRS